MNVIMRAVDSLRPYERNAKKHDEKQIANVARSIEKFGWRQPIVIDRDGVIVIGHCRYLAAMRLGQTEVPVVMADDLTDEEIRELRIIDNKTNESPWDFGTLTEEVVDLDFSGFELDLGGRTSLKPLMKSSRTSTTNSRRKSREHSAGTSGSAEITA